jgi:hypothetical protein
MSVSEVSSSIYSTTFPEVAEELFEKWVETLVMGKMHLHTKNLVHQNGSHDISGLWGQN